MLLCIVLWVIKMDNSKIKVDCRLTTRGTEKMNTKVVEDLLVADPEHNIGEQIIREAIGLKEDNNGNKSENPG